MYLYHFSSFYIFGLQLSHFGVLSAKIPSNWWSTSLPRLDKSYILFMRGFRQYTNLPFRIFMAHQHHPTNSLFNLPMISHVNLPIHARFPVNPWLHLRISEAPHNLHRSACQRWHLSAHRVRYLGQQNGRGSVTWAMVGPWAFPVTWRPGNRQWI